MHTDCSSTELPFQAPGGRKVVASFDGGRMSSDAGALLLRGANELFDVTGRLAACFSDGRAEERIEHPLEALIGQRVFGLALGYEDVNDHDRLRDDSVVALALGREDVTGEGRKRERDRGHPLAGSSTLNRLELGKPNDDAKGYRYKKILADPERIDRLLTDLFLEAHEEAPEEIVLDLDATDDPLHGKQEGRFFHGYYRCYCYLPLYIFCGDHVLCCRLRKADIDAAEGSVAEVSRIVGQIRERWPGTRIVLRGDSGFCRDDLMVWCEDNGVDFVFGAGADLASAEPDRAAASALAEPQREERQGGAALLRLPLAHGRQLEPDAPRGRQGGRVAGAAGRQSPFRRHQPRPRPDRDERPLRGAVLWAWRHGKPDQGAAAGPVRRPHLDGNHAGQPVAGVLLGLRLHADGDHPAVRTRRHQDGCGAVRHHSHPAVQDRRHHQGQRAPGRAVAFVGLSVPGAVPARRRQLAGRGRGPGLAGIAAVADAATTERRSAGLPRGEVGQDTWPARPNAHK